MPPSLYRVIKAGYRTVIPRSLDRVVFGGQSGFSRAVLQAKSALERTAAHDDLYDGVYYARQEREMLRSSLGIAASIREGLPQVHTVVDVGCGSGAILAALRDQGIGGKGLDYSEAALAICRDKGLEVIRFDLENPGNTPDWRADLALSTEVAEHLPETVADTYVDFLTSLSDVVIITAATPGQGGTDHVNEQPNSYWIDKFARRGFRHDPAETDTWRADWKARGVDRHRANNVMIFRRTTS